MEALPADPAAMALLMVVAHLHLMGKAPRQMGRAHLQAAKVDSSFLTWIIFKN